jgi:hypothetical protein
MSCCFVVLIPPAVFSEVIRKKINSPEISPKIEVLEQLP